MLRGGRTVLRGARARARAGSVLDSGATSSNCALCPEVRGMVPGGCHVSAGGHREGRGFLWRFRSCRIAAHESALLASCRLRVIGRAVGRVRYSRVVPSRRSGSRCLIVAACVLRLPSLECFLSLPVAFALLFPWQGVRRFSFPCVRRVEFPTHSWAPGRLSRIVHRVVNGNGKRVVQDRLFCRGVFAEAFFHSVQHVPGQDGLSAVVVRSSDGNRMAARFQRRRGGACFGNVARAVPRARARLPWHGRCANLCAVPSLNGRDRFRVLFGSWWRRVQPHDARRDASVALRVCRWCAP